MEQNAHKYAIQTATDHRVSDKMEHAHMDVLVILLGQPALKVSFE